MATVASAAHGDHLRNRGAALLVTLMLAGGAAAAESPAPGSTAGTDASSVTAPVEPSAGVTTAQRRITPSLAVRGTYTDNVDLAPAGRRLSDFVLELIPALRIVENGRRVKLRLSYEADGVLSTRNSSRSAVRNTLDASGNVEVVERFFFVDATGNISQVAINPVGPRAPSNANFTENRAESRTFQVSPYIRGKLLGYADYLLRYRVTDTRSNADLDNTRLYETSGRLSGTVQGTKVGWAIDALDQRIDVRRGRDTEQTSARATLTYEIDPRTRVWVDGGAERNDFATFDKETRGVYGGGVEWSPTTRTNARGQWEHRFFGSGWDLSLRHRMRLLSVQISDTRDVTTDAQRFGNLDRNVAYNILFNALTSRIPDPAERAIETDRLLSQGGIPSDLNLPPDFLTPGVFLNRSQQATLSLVGLRNTLALAVYRTKRQQFGAQDLVQSSFTNDVTERAASVSFSHRLTRLSSIAAVTSWRFSTTRAVANQDSRQWDARVLYTTRFGPKTAGTLEYRHVRFESDLRDTDFRENAVIASLLMQF